MQDLRIVLVIVGALAIAALVIHGLWTNQRNKRAQHKSAPSKSVAAKNERSANNRDHDGFDSDGVGSVRVVSKGNNKAPISHDRDQDPVFSGVPQFSAEDDDHQRQEPSAKSGKTSPAGVTVPVAEPRQPVKPTVAKIWKDVYVINVTSREGSYIYGRELKHALRILGFQFGDMDIYHRHVEVDGTGDVLFSMANMIKPGTFEPSKMDRLMTPGISLFMQLPEPGRAVAHFDLMLKAADKLAYEVDGVLMDARHNLLAESFVTQSRNELKVYDTQA